MANPRVGITLSVDGAEATASQIERVSARGTTALERLRGGFAQLGTQADYLESRTKKVARGVGDATGALELASRAIPSLSGNFGALAGTLGNVADVFGTFSAVLLRNPLGLLAVAATGAFVALNSIGDAADKATDATSRLTDEIARLQKEADKRGGGDPAIIAFERLTDLRAQLAEQQRALSEITSPAGGFSADFGGAITAGSDVEAARIRERVEELQKLIDVLGKASLAQDQADEIAQKRKRTGEEAEQSRLDQARAAEEAARAAEARARAEAASIVELSAQYARLAAQLDPVIARERENADTLALLDQAQQRLGISTEEITRLKTLAGQKAYEASEAGKADAAAVQEATRLYEAARTPLEEYERQLAAIARALEVNKINEEQATKAREQAKTQLDRATEESAGAKRTARELGLAFSSAFEDAVVGGKKLRDVIGGLGQDLLKVFIRRQLTEPLLELFDTVVKSSGIGGSNGLFGGLLGGVGNSIGGAIGRLFNPGTVLPGDPTGGLGPAFLANGGVFSGGAQIVPFARGGSIVNRPTMFPITGGKVGLMGEAGPEAIMPLERGKDGKLGVRGGGGGMVVNFSPVIDARGADKELRDRLPGLLRESEQRMVAEVRRLADRGGSFSRSVGRRVV